MTPNTLFGGVFCFGELRRVAVLDAADSGRHIYVHTPPLLWYIYMYTPLLLRVPPQTAWARGVPVRLAKALYIKARYCTCVSYRWNTRGMAEG